MSRSALLKDRLPSHLTRSLTGRTLAITFVTVGELTQWPYGAGDHSGAQVWTGSSPRSSSCPTAHASPPSGARARPTPNSAVNRPVNDSWVAACCLAREFLLTTLNIKDNVDYAEYEGLELLR